MKNAENLNYGFFLSKDKFNNEFNDNDFLMQNMNKNEELDIDYNPIFHNCIENVMVDSFNLQDFSIEEKIKIIKENNNNENIMLFNELFPSEENEKNEFTGKKRNLNNDDKITFKKNRNNLKNNYFQISYDKFENNNNTKVNITSDTSSSNHNSNKITYSKLRPDNFLIKFKASLGKSFIEHINNKIKSLTKRKIKFYSFNYKKFTLNVSYTQNQIWLNESMKYLLTLGEEEKQAKNRKALESIYKKKGIEFEEIKFLLELTYKEIIERFYLSEYFKKFKKDEKIVKLNDNFTKIMNISLLDQNGFINFLYTRKGNQKKGK